MNNLKELEKQVVESKEFKAILEEGGYGCRMQILFNGKEMLGTSMRKAPENPKELIEVLKDLIGFLSAPDVSDEEVLGKYNLPLYL